MGIRQVNKLKKGDMIEWYFYIGSKKIQRSTGQRYDTAQSLKVAQRIGEELETRIRAEQGRVTTGLTLADLHKLVADNIDTHVTREDYIPAKQSVDGWFRGFYKYSEMYPEMSVGELTGDMLYTYVDARKKPTKRHPDGLSGNTLRRHVFQGIKRGLDLAIARHKLTLEETQFVKFDWASLSRKIGRHIEREDLRGRFIASTDYCDLRAVVSSSVAVVMDFVYYTGVRATELSLLTWPMVLKSNGKWIVKLPRHITKNKKERSIPLNDTAYNAACQFLRDEGRFPDIAADLVYACTRTLQVENITLRDLRHTFATNLYRELAGDVATVAKIMGHNKETCYRYIHEDKERADEIIRKMDKRENNEDED